MTVEEWIHDATQKISRQDAELILQHFSFPDKDRSYLIAHPEITITQNSKLDRAVKLRASNCPIAYILKEKEFYGRRFRVEQGKTLIPRPETEDIIDFCLDIAEVAPSPLTIIDVGTGSGCLAITLALEIPDAKVTAIDISNEALKIAKRNAKQLAATIDFQSGNLMNNYNRERPDIIVANLPYVDEKWDWLDKKSLDYEPAQALYAENGGLELIYQLIEYFVKNGKAGASLILEADPSQHRAIINFAAVRKLELSRQRNFILQFTL